MTDPIDPMNPPPKPTAQVAVYSDVIGVEMAVAFLMRYGGAGCYIPKMPTGQHELVAFMGMDNVLALSRRANLPARVPLAKPWLARYWAWKGDSVSQIARKLKSTDTIVRRWVRS